MSRPLFVLCAPIAGHTHAVVAGALQKSCAECKQGVWVSRMTLFRAAEHPDGFFLLCIPCTIRRAEAGGEAPEIVSVTPGQREELRRAGVAQEWIDRLP